MEKLWKYKDKQDSIKVENLAKLLCMPKDSPTQKDIKCYQIIANLLVQRGIDTFDKAKDFFRPDLNKLHSPFLMEDMEKAVERIIIAIQAKERIMVYGDYDVDGTSAVALVYSYISTFYDNICYYIPDRYNEGYGVSITGIDIAERDSVTLIICLDCGIKATEEIDYANKKGIDFIVCDHHLPDKELPQAYAILDPKLESCHYPYDELSGCGIGFKLIQALHQKRERKSEELKQYLDLVAISIAADVVPVTGENRILAYHGLKVLNTCPRVGLVAILACANIEHKEKSESYYFNKILTLQDLSFLIGPRINAAGRMASASKVVDLLKTKNKEKAERIAEEINESNEDRKEKDRIATIQAQQEIYNNNWHHKKCIVLCNEDWHQGIIGIVASRIAEQELKPTIIFTKKNGILTGSARSIKNVDIYSAIEKCRHLLTHFGGHKFAAGLSLKEEDFEEFERLFEQEINQIMNDYTALPEIDIDMEISLSDATYKLLRLLQQFKPFGPGNTEPVFVSREIYDVNSARKVGTNHLKFSAISKKDSMLPISCIGFSLGEYYQMLKDDKKFDFCYMIEENTWQNHTELQLNVKDIKQTSEEIY